MPGVPIGDAGGWLEYQDDSAGDEPVLRPQLSVIYCNIYMRSIFWRSLPLLTSGALGSFYLFPHFNYQVLT